MIAVVYRWKLQAGTENEFRAAWREMTLAIKASHGALGSRLHRGFDGTWTAYAQWPSEAARQAAFAKPSPNPQAAERMKACITERFDEVVLEVTDDLLEPVS